MTSEKARKLAVILGTPGVAWKDSGVPFAHIVALRDGEAVAARARHCIHVFDDGSAGFDTGDGVLAVRDKCAIVEPRIDWPVVAAALQRPVRAFEGLTNTRSGQPPFQRLRNLVEDGYSGFAAPEDDDGCAAEILEATVRWNEWNREEVTMPERCREIVGAQLWGSRNEMWRTSQVDRFGRHCRGVGLHFGQNTPSDMPHQLLTAVLVAARELFNRL